MTRRDFKVWLAEDCEADAIEILNCDSAEDAAEEFMTDEVNYNTEGDYGDGDVVEVFVRDGDTVTKWEVAVTTSIYCSAREVQP